MNRKLYNSIRTIALGFALGISKLALAAAPSASTCASLLSMQASYKNCQANAATISQCIQNNLASPIPSSSGSISAQLQAASSASQSLAKLDFQCQYLLAYGSQPPVSNSGSSSNGGSLGSNLKKMLGLPTQNSSSATTPPSSSKLAQSNQATQLNNIKPVAPPASKADSNKDDTNSNSINWF